MQPFLCAAMLCVMVLHTFAELSRSYCTYLLSTFQAARDVCHSERELVCPSVLGRWRRHIAAPRDTIGCKIRLTCSAGVERVAVLDR